MTLGELKDQGLVPDRYQVHMLELQVTKECAQVGMRGQPHRYHCYMLSNHRVARDICGRLQSLWWALENMFPGIELYKQ